jgi:iron complex transport system ATP-binding protein
MTALLSAEGVTAATRDGRCLVKDVSLTLSAGELVGLIGPNGAGKTTLLKVLAGLRPCRSGQVLWQQQPLLRLPPAVRAQRIGYLEQRPQVHWPCSVRQVVALARLPFGDAASATGRAAVDAALATTGMGALAGLPFQPLSEGEKLQVHLARLLAGQPAAILADEPTAALDPARQLQVMTQLRAESRRGLAVLAVLHDLTLAARYCDRLLLLHHGETVAEGPVAEVLTAERLAAVYGVDGYHDAASGSVICRLAVTG